MNTNLEPEIWSSNKEEGIFQMLHTVLAKDVEGDFSSSVLSIDAQTQHRRFMFFVNLFEEWLKQFTN